MATAGDQTITVTDGDGNTGSATVTVTPAAASHFQVMAPASATLGVPFTVTVLALDPYGNVDTNYSGTVTWSSSDPNAVIDPNPYTFTAADAGMASFTVTLNLTGFQNITVTDTAGVTGSATISVTLADGADASGMVSPERTGSAPVPAPPSQDTIAGLFRAGRVAEPLAEGGAASLASPEALDIVLDNLDDGLPYGTPIDDLVPIRLF